MGRLGLASGLTAGRELGAWPATSKGACAMSVVGNSRTVLRSGRHLSRSMTSLIKPTTMIFWTAPLLCSCLDSTPWILFLGVALLTTMMDMGEINKPRTIFVGLSHAGNSETSRSSSMSKHPDTSLEDTRPCYLYGRGELGAEMSVSRASRYLCSY